MRPGGYFVRELPKRDLPYRNGNFSITSKSTVVLLGALSLESEISAKAYSRWRLREELPKRDRWCQKRTRRRAAVTLRRSGKWGVRPLQITGAAGPVHLVRQPITHSSRVRASWSRACAGGGSRIVRAAASHRATTCHQRTSMRS